MLIRRKSFRKTAFTKTILVATENAILLPVVHIQRTIWNVFWFAHTTGPVGSFSTWHLNSFSFHSPFFRFACINFSRFVRLKCTNDVNSFVSQQIFVQISCLHCIHFTFCVCVCVGNDWTILKLWISWRRASINVLTSTDHMVETHRMF